MMRRAIPVLVVLLSSVAGTAGAQVVVSNDTERFRSPQRFALEVRVGPYSPDVDEEFAGTPDRPHDNFFEGSTRVMTQVELDFQLFRRFGTAAIGLSVGYFRENGNNLAAPPKNAAEDMTPNYGSPRSADKTRLSLYPVALLAVYRADQLFRRYGIPFIPYGKLGLNYTMWSVYDSNDEVVEHRGARGRGATRGWQGAVGMSLVLDFIDPGGARALDSETGVNHTHAFFELAHFDVSGLGQKNRLNVGDTTWMAGLLFEF